MLKTLHIVSAILWLGNFAVTGLWSIRAVRVKTLDLRRFAAGEILFTDAVFTLIFGSAVTISGIALAHAEGINLISTLWTRAALIAVAAAGAVWVFVLLPLELRMRAQAILSDERFSATFLWWNVAGWVTTVVLFCIVYLMVAKPA